LKKKGGQYGDHYYKVRIAVPKSVSAEDLAAVDRLESKYGENPRASLKVKL